MSIILRGDNCQITTLKITQGRVFKMHMCVPVIGSEGRPSSTCSLKSDPPPWPLSPATPQQHPSDRAHFLALLGPGPDGKVCHGAATLTRVGEARRAGAADGSFVPHVSSRRVCSTVPPTCLHHGSILCPIVRLHLFIPQRERSLSPGRCGSTVSRGEQRKGPVGPCGKSPRWSSSGKEAMHL